MKEKQQLVIKNFEDKLKIFTQAVGGHNISEESFILSNTGIPTDTFNIVLVKSVDITDDSNIKLGLDQLNDRDFPYCAWIAADDLNNNWINLLNSYQLNEAERNAMMVLDDTNTVKSNNDGKLNIQLVDNEATLAHYSDIFISMFKGSNEYHALIQYFQRFSLEATAPSTKMFVGYIDSDPVSTGLLIKGGSSYGIYDVMTVESQRGRGYGSEMFEHLLMQTEDKSMPVVLQASDDGKNIYRRFGFKEVGEIIVFEK